MDLEGIIAISGKPGLYKIIKQGRNNLIIEAIETGRKMSALGTDRISALEEISIYGYEEDFPLPFVYRKIYEITDGGKAPSSKESKEDLEKFFEQALPDYDDERVKISHIQKAYKWYNLLHDKNLLKLKEEEKSEESQEEDVTEGQTSSEEINNSNDSNTKE